MNTHSSTVSLTDNQQAAQERLETSEGRREFWRATVSCWLGTTMEYADFALYGLAAGIIFGDVFFPEATPVMALLSSFAAYSVGFIARPIGALLFGWIGDKHGRKNCHGYHYWIDGHVDHANRINPQLRPDRRLGTDMSGYPSIFLRGWEQERNFQAVL